MIVFLCNWVKAISQGSGATMKRDEYGFTLVNFNRLIPISAQSFVFPIQVEQVSSQTPIVSNQVVGRWYCGRRYVHDGQLWI